MVKFRSINPDYGFGINVFKECSKITTSGRTLHPIICVGEIYKDDDNMLTYEGIECRNFYGCRLTIQEMIQITNKMEEIQNG